MSGFAERIVGLQLGPYQVRRLVARGGMGIVYEGFQPSLDRVVAIKVLYPHLSDDPAFVERFQREARAVARLNHPHIVRMIDYGCDQGYYFMVMDYITGGSLRQVLTDSGGGPIRMPVAHALGVLAQIGAALAWAHRRGYVHRDVKPGNILIDEDGNAALSDFGLVKMLDSNQLTMTGAIVGTPDYMAPEQSDSSRAVGPPADQYSLAVVAYELLAGRVPFSAPTPAAMIHKHLFEPPPSPRTLDPTIASEGDAVLMRALAKDPEARYPTVDEFVRSLIQAVGVVPAGSATVIASDPGSGGTPTPVWSATGATTAGNLAPAADATTEPRAAVVAPASGAAIPIDNVAPSSPSVTAVPDPAAAAVEPSAASVQGHAAGVSVAASLASPGTRRFSPALIAAALVALLAIGGGVAWFGFFSGDGSDSEPTPEPTSIAGVVGSTSESTPAEPTLAPTATVELLPSVTATAAPAEPSPTLVTFASTPTAPAGPTETPVIISRPVAPTPTVPQIAVGDDSTIIAQYSFDDGSPGRFTTGTFASGNSAAVTDGKYTMTLAANNWQTSTNDLTIDLADGIILATAQLQGDGAVGLTARSQNFDDGTFTFFICWLTSGAQAGCSAWTNGAWSELFRVDTPGVSAVDSHTLGMGIAGENLLFQIDDTVVGTTTASAAISAAGYWGFYVESGASAESTGLFDTVIIAESEAGT